MAKLTPPIEAIIRHKEVFNTSANPNLPAHINKFKKNLEIEQDKIKSVIQELADMRERMGNYNDYKEKLTKILDGALVEFKDKEEYTTYSFEVKNFSKDLFKEMGILLEKMKLIKKEKEGIFNKENNLTLVAGKEEFKKN